MLFVCTANICRSPAMELIARDLAGDADVVFSSAGTHARDGHRMNPEMGALLPDGMARGLPQPPPDPRACSTTPTSC